MKRSMKIKADRRQTRGKRDRQATIRNNLGGNNDCESRKDKCEERETKDRVGNRQTFRQRVQQTKVE